jgi:hypothetical protein
MFKTTPALELAARRVADIDALRPSSTSKDRVADVDAPRPSSASQDVGVSRGASDGVRRAPRRRRRQAAAKAARRKTPASPSDISDASDGARREPRRRRRHTATKAARPKTSASLATPALEPVGRQVAAVDAPRRGSTPQHISVPSGGAHRALRRRRRRVATKQRVPGASASLAAPAMELVKRRDAGADTPRPKQHVPRRMRPSATSATPASSSGAATPAQAHRDQSSTSQDVSVPSDASVGDVRDASGGAHRAQRRQCRRAATKQRVQERQRLKRRQRWSLLIAAWPTTTHCDQAARQKISASLRRPRRRWWSLSSAALPTQTRRDQAARSGRPRL